MELKVATTSGSVHSVEVSDAVFCAEYKEALVHQVVVAYMAKGRSGTKAQKTRSQVRGGGAKPWRQKGTGRARAGTSRSPIWRSGGVTFAAQPRDYSQKVNRKMYRNAMCSVLSELVRQERLLVADNLDFDEPKTKELLSRIAAYKNDSVLIVTESDNEAVYLASRNLHNVLWLESQEVDPIHLVGYEKVLVTAEALKKIEERLV